MFTSSPSIRGLSGVRLKTRLSFFAGGCKSFPWHVAGFGGLLIKPAWQVSFSFEHDHVGDAQGTYHPDVHADMGKVIAVTQTGGEQLNLENVEIMTRWTHENSKGTGEWHDHVGNAVMDQMSTARVSGEKYAHVLSEQCSKTEAFR